MVDDEKNSALNLTHTRHRAATWRECLRDQVFWQREVHKFFSFGAWKLIAFVFFCFGQDAS